MKVPGSFGRGEVPSVWRGRTTIATRLSRHATKLALEERRRAAKRRRAKKRRQEKAAKAARKRNRGGKP